jgi:hypothetical protein
VLDDGSTRLAFEARYSGAALVRLRAEVRDGEAMQGEATGWFLDGRPFF